jgi:hypothetical protein
VVKGRGRELWTWLASHWDLLFLFAVWMFYLYHATIGVARE